eukprot:11167043-Lingulodinium_polyedra.AAC.1
MPVADLLILRLLARPHVYSRPTPNKPMSRLASVGLRPGLFSRPRLGRPHRRTQFGKLRLCVWRKPLWPP